MSRVEQLAQLCEGIDGADRTGEPFIRDRYGKPALELEPAVVYQFGSLLRLCEQTLLKMFSQGLLSGTTHTCIGQELCQMAVVRALTHPDDAVMSNHRNHGHFLTYSGDFLGLLGEVMGRQCGVCGGIGGSQHIAFRHFHSNGVQAGMSGIGVGQAATLQKRGSEGIVAVVVGDGTLGEGLLYESMNLAAVWAVPVLFVVEHNGIAQTTPTTNTIGGGSGAIEARGAAFGLSTWRLDDTASNFLAQVEQIVAEVRSRRYPGMLVIETNRLGPHSKGDDLRSAEEMRLIGERDPLMRIRRSLPAAIADRIDLRTKSFIAAVEAQALSSPEASRLIVRRHMFEQAPDVPTALDSETVDEKGKTVRVALNDSLGAMLETHPEVVVLGEDLHEPYGGAFKVTAGLTVRFPERVISTPISEAGIVGAAIGMAMAGQRPVVEIMFADFTTLIVDQLYNQAVKFPGMFDNVAVPLVVRMPAGGRRGYGPTHSQSPESLLMAVPGLTIVFPSQRHAPGECLRRATIEWPYPTIFMEHKLLYGRKIDSAGYRVCEPDPRDPGAALFPTLVSGPDDPDITLVCYGDTVTLAEGAAAKLQDEELRVEILAPCLLTPTPRHTFGRVLAHRSRVIVIEEAPAEVGFGAEIAALLLSVGFRGQFARVGTPPVPIPAARSLETQVMPGVDDIIDTVARLIMSGPVRPGPGKGPT